MGDPEKQPKTTTQPTQQSSGMVTLNVSYIIPRGILKIIEIFLLLIAFACAADVCTNCGGGRYSFFLFATVCPWLICIIFFILFLFCLVDKIPQVNWNLTVLINSILWAVLLLIAASLWADAIRKSNVNVSTLYASVIFAFFAFIAFIVDIVVHIKLYR